MSLAERRRKHAERLGLGVAPGVVFRYEPKAKPIYFRSRKDWIAHLAVIMSDLHAHQIKAAHDTGEGDLHRASNEEIAEAKALLVRAGVRAHDDTPPPWWFADGPIARKIYV